MEKLKKNPQNPTTMSSVQLFTSWVHDTQGLGRAMALDFLNFKQQWHLNKKKKEETEGNDVLVW